MFSRYAPRREIGVLLQVVLIGRDQRGEVRPVLLGIEREERSAEGCDDVDAGEMVRDVGNDLVVRDDVWIG